MKLCVIGAGLFLAAVAYAGPIEWEATTDFDYSIAQDWQIADIEADRVTAEQIVALRDSVESASNKITAAIVALTAAVTALGVVQNLPQKDSSLININQATVEQLRTLPGIGLGVAKSIVATRSNGNFTSIDDLARVPKLTAEQIIAIKDKITF